MPDAEGSQSTVMARLTLSALERASHDPACWSDPLVYRALLVSGLSGAHGRDPAVAGRSATADL
jgi:hypothetical protein